MKLGMLFSEKDAASYGETLGSAYLSQLAKRLIQDLEMNMPKDTPFTSNEIIFFLAQSRDGYGIDHRFIYQKEGICYEIRKIELNIKSEINEFPEVGISFDYRVLSK